MKIYVPMFLSLAIISVPVSAYPKVLGQLSHTTITDDEAGINFDLNGLDFRYMNFANTDLILEVVGQVPLETMNCAFRT